MAFEWVVACAILFQLITDALLQHCGAYGRLDSILETPVIGARKARHLCRGRYTGLYLNLFPKDLSPVRTREALTFQPTNLFRALRPISPWVPMRMTLSVTGPSWRLDTHSTWSLAKMVVKNMPDSEITFLDP
ncbi:hypothetical protein DFS33DRAFT_1277549 [Desarmillaria ectypa]|nr:hypothetical protein DFS33DRAFT_1277549 [Desarmillaria ectypa]